MFLGYALDSTDHNILWSVRFLFCPWVADSLDLPSNEPEKTVSSCRNQGKHLAYAKLSDCLTTQVARLEKPKMKLT